VAGRAPLDQTYTDLRHELGFRAPQGTLMRVVAAGITFRSAPLEAREAAAIPEPGVRSALRYLVGHAGMHGAAVLSTCNRTEFYVTCPDEDAGDVVARIAPYLDPDGRHNLAGYLTAMLDESAVEHLMRVACGLDSMVIGEVQVLGQLKDAIRLAQEAGTLDARLDFVLRRAVSAGKLVRSETSLGRGVGNLAEVAAEAARECCGSLRERGVLLVGAGSMSRLAARRLRAMGANIIVTARGESRRLLADAVGGTAIRPSQLVEFAPRLDAVLCCTSSDVVVVDAATVAAMQRARQGAPLCIVDLAVPRDVDPAAAHVGGVTLVDIDDVGRRLLGHEAVRRQAVAAATEIVEREARRTMTVIGERDAAAPTITALLRRAEAIRRRELERTLSRSPELDATIRERIDVLTASLVRKLLHAPVTHLRESSDDPSVALTLRQAFDLDDTELDGRRAERRAKAST
jgi:glutamyl-tRNA reductase